MKFVKFFSVFFVLAAMMYIAGCSSAEQTTAKLAYNNGDYAKAEMEFAKETQQNPQNEEAWFYLAMSRIKLGKFEDAKVAYTNYTKLGKNSFKSQMETEWAASFDEGVKKFTAAESQSKANNTEGALKTYKEALSYFEVASFLMPSDTNSINNANITKSRITTLSIGPTLEKADTYVNNGQYAEAVSEYQAALTKAGSDWALREAILNGLSIGYLKWSESLRTANDETYKAKYTEALPYIEELNQNTQKKELKITTYDWLVVMYGGLGMNDKAADAIKMRDELKK